MRKEATVAERKLWSQLRGKKIEGLRFRRQYAIEGYIADFCCLERKLVIEVDGERHSEQQRYDAERTRELEALGFRVIRFWNDEVIADVEGVVKQISDELKKIS